MTTECKHDRGWWKVVPVVSLLLLIALGGAVAGYSGARIELAAAVTAAQDQHRAEIDRLQAATAALLRSKEEQLGWLSGRLIELTATTGTAARTSEAAAKTSARAAAGAAAAAKAAGATAAAVAKRPAVPEEARRELNAAIEQANRAIVEPTP
jgi:hypothetical protein